MGLINFIRNLIRHTKFKQYRLRHDGTWREIHYRKPLYRKHGKVYWKGIPVDDDLFDELMRSDPEERNLYNKAVRRANKRIKRNRRYRNRIKRMLK